MRDVLELLLPLTLATLAVLVPYRVLRKNQTELEHTGFSIRDLIRGWKTRTLARRIEVMVLMIGDHTDGVLKGQIPRWLVPHNQAHGGQGEFQVLVSCQNEYYPLHFKVDNWKPRYGEVEPIRAEVARQVMELHLEYLGRWKPLQSL